jgi:competence protein ComEA
MSAHEPAALPPYPAPVAAPVDRLGAEWQRLRLYAGGTLLALCFALFGWQVWRGREPAPVAVQTLATGTDTGTGTSTDTGGRSPAGAEIRVQVAGAVARPGVYRLAAGDRVEDAVNAAGGFADGADTGGVNLARRLRDEQRLDVPAVGDEARQGALPGNTGTPTPGSTGSAASGTRPAGGDTLPGSAGPRRATTPSASGPGGVTPASAADRQRPSRVNVNTATADELERLPGIGPVSARRILAYRQAKGPIASLDQLHDAGVPETVVRRAAPLLTFE